MQILKKNPTLKDPLGNNLYNIVILDEVHERNDSIDIILYLMISALKNNNDLKLVLLSATIDPKLYESYFKQHDITFSDMLISGQPMKEVTKIWSNNSKAKDHKSEGIRTIKKILDHTIDSDDENFNNDDEYKRMINIVSLVHDDSKDNNKKDEFDKKGGIIFFVPFSADSDKICSSMRDYSDDMFANVKIFCEGLHAKRSEKDQQLIIDETSYKNSVGGPYGRKIVIATNVAESSLTVKGLSYVIESGFKNIVKYDPEGMRTEQYKGRISQAEAKQRWGRVGRTKPGIVYMLYTEGQFNSDFDEFPTPNILEKDMLPYIFQFLDIFEKQNKYKDYKVKYDPLVSNEKILK